MTLPINKMEVEPSSMPSSPASSEGLEKLEQAHSSNGNVQVVVRIRPPNAKEKDQGYTKCVALEQGSTTLQLLKPTAKSFTFDYVADEAATQDEIFSRVGKPITDACMQGYHCCLLAYGQTGAGKTFTMEGPSDDYQPPALSPGLARLPSVPLSSVIGKDKGLIPRALDYIFTRMAETKEQNPTKVDFSVKCSYLQIYNEQVSDLLEPEATNLLIREDARRGHYVEGAQEVVVSTAEATYNVFKRGSSNRTVGMTAMNAESSRSHGVFIVHVESSRRTEGGVLNRRTSRFYLVDLAGSERQKHSEASGVRLKEAGSINKSLSALGNVIKALVDNSQGKVCHVPYRDSKLTFLIKDALGGNSKCSLVAAISPAEKNCEETLSTLKFAQRAKLMRNSATINDEVFGNPAVMGEEIRRLRLEIASLRANLASSGGAELLGGVITPGGEPESAKVARLEHIIAASTKRALAAERRARQEKDYLEKQADAFQNMLERAGEEIQGWKMMFRLRDVAFQKLRKGHLAVGPEHEEEHQKEIKVLQRMLDHHPDVVRFKLETEALKYRLAELEAKREEESDDEKIEMQEDTIRNLTTELSEKAAEKTDLQRNLAAAAAESSELKEKFQASEGSGNALQALKEQMAAELKEEKAARKKTEEALKGMLRELDLTRSESSRFESLGVELQQRLQMLEREKAAEKETVDVQKCQLDKLSQELKELEANYKNVCLERDLLTDQMEGALTAESTARQKVQESESERDSMKSTLDELMSRYAESAEARALAEATALKREQERAEAHKVAEEAVACWSSAEDRLQLLDQQLSAALQDQTSATEAKEKLSAVEKERDLVQKQMEDEMMELTLKVKQCREEVDRKDRSLEGLQKELKSLSDSSEALRVAHASEKEALEDQAKQALGKAEEAEKTCQSCTDELENARKELQGALEERASLEHEKDSLFKEVREMAFKVQDTKRELDELRAELDVSVSRAETAEHAAETARKQVADMDVRLEVLQKQVQREQDAKLTAEGALEEATKNAQVAQAEAAVLREELKRAVEETSRLAAQVKTLGGEANELREQEGKEAPAEVDAGALVM